MSRRHTVLESLAPAVLGSLQGYLSAVGRASPHKAEGLSIGAMPTLPAWSHGERARGPPACRPAHCPSPARRCLAGSSPLRPAEQGLTRAVSHSLPRPSRWPLPSALRVQGTTQTEQPAVSWELGARGSAGTGHVVPPAVPPQVGHGAPPTAPHPARGRALSAGQHGQRQASPPAQPCRAPVALRDPAAPPPWGSLTRLVLGQSRFPRPSGRAPGQP